MMKINSVEIHNSFGLNEKFSHIYTLLASGNANEQNHRENSISK